MRIFFKYLFLVVVMILYALNSCAQTTFSKKIHYGVRDNATQFIRLYNDTLYIPVGVGVQNQFEPAPWSASLLVMDINGNVLPQSFYQPTISTQITVGQSFYKSPTDKFYFNATISHQNKNDVISSLVIFNKSRDTLAIKTFGDTTFWNLMSWIEPKRNESNKLLIFGVSDSLCASGHHGYCHPIIRVVDTLGNLIETKSYMNSSHQRDLYNVDTTINDKGYIVSGYELLNTSTGQGQAYLMKLDSSLNLQWQKYYYSLGSTIPRILSLHSGSYILGYASVDSIGGLTFYSRLALSKMDNNGNVIWNKKYATLEKNASVNSVRELPNGDLVACGILDQPTSIPNFKQFKGFLLKTDSSGNLKWFQTYKATNPNDLNGVNYLYDIALMNDGGFALAGQVGTTDTAAQLTWVLRVDSTGCLTAGCNPYDIEGYNDFPRLSVFPSPALSTISIVSSQELGTISIYTSLGEAVLQTKTKNTQEQIDVSQLPPGVYIIQSKEWRGKFIKE